jgi:hypothetical protein
MAGLYCAGRAGPGGGIEVLGAFLALAARAREDLGRCLERWPPNHI